MVALCAIASLSQQVFAAETIATPLAVTVQRAMAPDSSATTFSQVDGSQPGVSTPVSLLMTMDGEVVWARNCDTKRAVASTIKMLNALVVMDRAKLDDQVTVPPKAASIPDGGVGLVAGQRFTVRQLLEMMLVASANDAAETLAISVSGNETDFVAAMNAKAASLGLDSTHATDPHGLGKTEVSTARDLSVLARAVMAQPELREIVLGRSVSVSKPSGKSARVDATNELLGRYPGIEGVKTGFTNASGYCFVGAAKRGDVELLGVVLGANSNPARFSQMRTLLDWGFSRVRHERVVASSTVLASVPVSGGDTSTVGVRAAEDLAALTVAGGDEAAVQLELPQVVAAPVTSGQVLGTVEVVRRGTVVARTALVAAGPVPAVAGGRAIAPLPALVRPTTFAGELGAIVAEVFSSAKL
jgi:D-alanyl-D-alanine carboxypeptidase (penicillin-binding protein 5/6)